MNARGEVWGCREMVQGLHLLPVIQRGAPYGQWDVRDPSGLPMTLPAQCNLTGAESMSGLRIGCLSISQLSFLQGFQAILYLILSLSVSPQAHFPKQRRPLNQSPARMVLFMEIPLFSPFRNLLIFYLAFSAKVSYLAYFILGMLNEWMLNTFCKLTCRKKGHLFDEFCLSDEFCLPASRLLRCRWKLDLKEELDLLEDLNEWEQSAGERPFKQFSPTTPRLKSE